MVADDNGSFQARVVIPADAVGSHTLHYLDTAEPAAAMPTNPLVVSVAEQLAITGLTATYLLWPAALVIMIGVLLLVMSNSPAWRRREFPGGGLSG